MALDSKTKDLLRNAGWDMSDPKVIALWEATEKIIRNLVIDELRKWLEDPTKTRV
jgi:hypothetical protein